MNDNTLFENIKHVEADVNDFWYARELMKALEYSDWRNFKKVIDKAILSCESSGKHISEQLVEVNKLLKKGNNADMLIKDYKLSRYMCYLIAQNSDPRKEVVALAQTYFAIQTRKQELLEKEYFNLSEDDKRIFNRKLVKNSNLSLNKTALKSGVKCFDIFTNAGYKGLYNGETADDIAKRKNLRYRQDILDHMNSDELILNLFRISQTEQKLKNENIDNEYDANSAHYKVGKEIRNTIKRIGGTMPEDMLAPIVSVKEINKNKKLKP